MASFACAARATIGAPPRVRSRNAPGRHRARATRARAAAATEALEELLTRDDVLASCAQWGNVCVTFGTHYTPIAAPSIVASLFIFVPLLVVAKKAREQEKRIFFLEEALENATRSTRDEEIKS
jgi:hypothetical protein